MPKTRFTADLPPDLFEWLMAQADAEGVSRNVLLAEAVRDLIAKRKSLPLPDKESVKDE